MAFRDLLREPLTLLPPDATPDGQGGYVSQLYPTGAEQRTLGRIEDRPNQGRRLVGDQGDVPLNAYLLYLLPDRIDESGRSMGPVEIGEDWFVIDSLSRRFQVVGFPTYAKRRETVHHIECQLDRVAGGI